MWSFKFRSTKEKLNLTQADISKPAPATIRESQCNLPGTWMQQVAHFIGLGLPLASIGDHGPRGVLILAEQHGEGTTKLVDSIISKLSARTEISVTAIEGALENYADNSEMEFYRQLGFERDQLRRPPRNIPSHLKLVGIEKDPDIFRLQWLTLVITNVLDRLANGLAREETSLVFSKRDNMPRWRIQFEEAMNKLVESKLGFPEIDLEKIATPTFNGQKILTSKNWNAINAYWDDVFRWVKKNIGNVRNLGAAEIIEKNLPPRGLAVLVIGASHTTVLEEASQYLPIQDELSKRGISFAIVHVNGGRTG